MELVAEINQRLLDYFGRKFDKPQYRVIWSNNEREKRWTDVTPEGFSLQQPEVIEMPKYSYLKDMWVLERLFEVGPNNPELTEKLSYEPIWVFMDNEGIPLPPKWEACEYVIHCINQKAAQVVGAKYKDPLAAEKDPKVAIEAKEARIKALQEQLFGNETPVGDALSHGYGVVVPKNYEKVN